MDLKALRRKVAVTQVGTALAVPVVYLAAVAAGVLLFSQDLLMLMLLLDILMLLQGRSLTRASSVAPKRLESPELPERFVDAADESFVRFLRADALCQAAGMFVFLFALDQLARIRLAGGDSPGLLIGGVAGAFALIAVGRFASRSAAWRDFAAAHADLWGDPAGLNRGRTASSALRYLDWRASVRVSKAEGR